MTNYENQQTATSFTQVNVANVDQNLRDRCGRKQFKIQSNTSCAAQGEEVHIPNLRPLIEVRWGDGPQDQIETDDVEVLCIVASNPYTNVTIKDLTIVFAVVNLDDGSPAPPLPDGTPSVSITPSEMIGFGDLPPRDSHRADSTVGREAREIMLISRGARQGDYLLKLHYSFAVEVTVESEDQFPLQLVKS